MMFARAILTMFMGGDGVFRPLMIRGGAILVSLVLALVVVRVGSVEERLSWGIGKSPAVHASSATTTEISLSASHLTISEANYSDSHSYDDDLGRGTATTYYIPITVTASRAPATSTDVYFKLVTLESDTPGYSASRSDVRFSDNVSTTTTPGMYRVQMPAASTSTVLWMATTHDDEIEAYPEETLQVALATSTDGRYSRSSQDNSFDVTLREGVCDRTLEVCEELVRIAGHSPESPGACYIVRREDIEHATSTEIDMSSSTATTLKPGDFGNLPLLEKIHLTNNALESLPPGLFNGLTKLNDLDFSRNDDTLPPLPITAKLVPAGTDPNGGQRLRVYVPTGAPFDMQVDLEVSGVEDVGQYILELDGVEQSSTTTMTVDAGSVTSSSYLRVLTNLRDPDGVQADVSLTQARFVDPLASPTVPFPDRHKGLQATSDATTLRVDAELDSRVGEPVTLKPQLSLDMSIEGLPDDVGETATTTENDILNIVVRSNTIVATSSNASSTALTGSIVFLTPDPEATTTPALEWGTDIRPSGTETSTVAEVDFSIEQGATSSATLSFKIVDNKIVDHWFEYGSFAIAPSSDYTLGSPSKVDIVVFEGVCDRTVQITDAIATQATSTFALLDAVEDCDDDSLQSRNSAIQEISRLYVEGANTLKSGDLRGLGGLNLLSFVDSPNLLRDSAEEGHAFFPDGFFHNVDLEFTYFPVATSDEEQITYHIDFHVDFDRLDMEAEKCYFNYESIAGVPFRHGVRLGFRVMGDPTLYKVEHLQDAGVSYEPNWAHIHAPRLGAVPTTVRGIAITPMDEHPYNSPVSFDAVTDSCREGHNHPEHSIYERDSRERGSHEREARSSGPSPDTKPKDPVVSIRSVSGSSQELELVLDKPSSVPLEVMYNLTAPATEWNSLSGELLVAIVIVDIPAGTTTVPLAFDINSLSNSWFVLPEEVTYRLISPRSIAGYDQNSDCNTAVVDDGQVFQSCGPAGPIK